VRDSAYLAEILPERHWSHHDYREHIRAHGGVAGRSGVCRRPRGCCGARCTGVSPSFRHRLRAFRAPDCLR
jgi:hypothetical protein